MNLRPVWAEIDLKAIAENIREIRRITNPEAKICAVVKANAYGHGEVEVSEVVLANGADYLAVALISEANQLRQAGINAPILILGYTPHELLGEVVQNNVTQTILSFDHAKDLSKVATNLNKTAKIHIKIDTGMGRIGFKPEDESLIQIKKITDLPNIEIEGIFTHFAVSDIPEKDFTLQQLETFLQFTEKLSKAGINIPIRHTANSAAIIDLPETHLDMVRIGVSLYGLYPSNEVQKEKVKLTPAMALKAKVVQVKHVEPGTTVSYGRTWCADKETIIATLPIGYADGYTRLLSNKGEVLIAGKRANIVGRICMDQCMIDVTDIPNVKQGDEVVLFGAQNGKVIPVEEISDKLGTINYEIVCMVSERVPRVYLR